VRNIDRDGSGGQPVRAGHLDRRVLAMVMGRRTVTRCVVMGDSMQGLRVAERERPDECWRLSGTEFERETAIAYGKHEPDRQQCPHQEERQ